MHGNLDGIRLKLGVRSMSNISEQITTKMRKKSNIKIWELFGKP